MSVQWHNASVGKADSDHGTGRKRQKVEPDQEDDGVDDQAKRKQTNKEASTTSISLSMSLDHEVIEDDNNFRSHDINEMEENQSSEEESYKLIDSQAVEDNDHLEFEEDFDGEDREEEAYRVDRMDKDVQGSDSETDASDGSVYAPSDVEEEEGTDGNMTKLHIPGSAKQMKGKRTNKETSNSGDHPSMSLSTSLDSEVIEDDNNFCSHDINEMEEDQSSEEESSELIDSEAVEDNDHHEFEEDFDGEDSEEEAYGVDRTDEDVQGSDSETDASDGNESDDSFVVNDDSVEYTQENDSLDQLDEAAEIVSKRRVPQEPPTWLSKYEEAVEKGGFVEVTINCCIFIGPSGTGKSCLKHLLVHNKPKKVKISTPVMEKPDVVTISAEKYEVKGTSDWVPLTDETLANSIRSSCQNREYDVGDAVTVPKDGPEKQDSTFTSPVEEINLPTVARKVSSRRIRTNPAPPKSASLKPTQLCPFQEAHSHLMADPNLGDSVLLNGGRFVHLLDTGGQPSFQAVLPLLLDVPCTFLLIFNAARGLNELVPITYRPDKATVVESGSSSEKAWAMMLRSLSSVYNLAHKVSSNAQALLETNRLPPFRAVIVGTFKDCLIEKGNIASATQEIAEHMQLLEKKPYYSQIIPDSEGQLFHLVNNFPHYEASGHTLENQASVNSLREILSHPDGALKAKIPIGWYHFQIICRKVDQKFFKFSDLLQHARELKCVTSADQFRSLLQLFHTLGVFTFIDHEDVSHMVCTDSSAFMQVVSKLLAVEFLTAPKRPAVKMFKKTGILSLDRGLFNELGISKVVDPEWLLRCLCHLGVAACVSPAGTDTPEYFIPAALPPEGKAVVCGSVAPLLVAFRFKANAFIAKEDFPHGIFARLAVELANNGWEVITEKNTRLSIRFHWKELDISIVESAGFIRIVPIVSVLVQCSVAKLHECCSAVQSTFKAAIHASAQAVLGSKFTDKADTVIGFACPCKARPSHIAFPSGNSIVCTVSSERQVYSKSHQVWFSHVEGAQLQPHPCNSSIFHLVDPTSRGRREGAATFPVTEFLEKHETEFFSVVNARLSLQRLQRKGVITQDIESRINAATNDEDAKEILFAHLLHHTDVDTLLKYCKVIIAANGYPKMQSLGMKMKEDLQRMQGGSSSPVMAVAIGTFQ